MIAFALFGAGRIGRMHAENLVRRSDAKLLYVVDSKPEAARALAEPLGAKQATEQQAFADPAVIKRLTDLGQDLPPREQLTPEALAAFHKYEIDKWWPLIRAANIKVE